MKLAQLTAASFLLTLLFSIQSSAENSEFFWQASAGQNIFSTALEFDASKEALYSGGNQTSQGPIFHFQYDYGLNEMLDFGVSTNYASLSQFNPTDGSTNQSGLGNFVFFSKGTHTFDFVNVKFGLNLSLSPDNAQLKLSKDKNNYSGRSTATPYIGAEFPVGVFFFGLRLSDDIALSDIKEDVASTSQTDAIQGGNSITFDLFAEGNYGQGELGLKIERITTSQENDKTANSITKIPDSTGLGFYGTLNMGAVTGVGQVKFSKLSSTDKISYGTDWDYQLGIRLAF